MYKELFDDQHRLVSVALKEVKGRDAHTGEFESDILCLDCDNNVLGSLESYAKTVLYGGQLPKGSNVKIQNQRNQHGVEFTYVTGLDYIKFKLFLLSVLWRASISNRPFFKNISLGPYEEKIRKMLLSGDPGAASAYPCVMSSYKKHDLPAGVIGEPRKIKKGSNAFVFLINGIIYYFYVTHKTAKDWVLEAAINEQGEMKLIHTPEENSKKILNSFFGAELFK